MDGVDETLDIATITKKGLRLAGVGQGQGEPEARYHGHCPEVTPPVSPPRGYTGRRAPPLPLLCHGCAALPNVVHVVHARCLLWLMPALPLAEATNAKKAHSIALRGRGCHR